MQPGGNRLDQAFDINRIIGSGGASNQYQQQLRRLQDVGNSTECIEKAVTGAIQNLSGGGQRAFVIYGEPQSGKTEMMICLTAKLLDEGYRFIIHMLNDSVDLLGQNLGRFHGSGLAPSAHNFNEILVEGLGYSLCLMGDRHDDFKHERRALFRFMINAAHLNLTSRTERNFSLLVHTSGKKIDHKTDLVYLKHSAKRLPPWQFTYFPEHIDELARLQERAAKVWLLNVCGQDGVVAISLDEFTSINRDVANEAAFVRVDRGRNTMYRVNGNAGRLAKAKRRGLHCVVQQIEG